MPLQRWRRTDVHRERRLDDRQIRRESLNLPEIIGTDDGHQVEGGHSRHLFGERVVMGSTEQRMFLISHDRIEVVCEEHCLDVRRELTDDRVASGVMHCHQVVIGDRRQDSRRRHGGFVSACESRQQRVDQRQRRGLESRNDRRCAARRTEHTIEEPSARPFSVCRTEWSPGAMQSRLSPAFRRTLE